MKLFWSSLQNQPLMNPFKISFINNVNHTRSSWGKVLLLKKWQWVWPITCLLRNSLRQFPWLRCSSHCNYRECHTVTELYSHDWGFQIGKNNEFRPYANKFLHLILTEILPFAEDSTWRHILLLISSTFDLSLSVAISFTNCLTNETAL